MSGQRKRYLAEQAAFMEEKWGAIDKRDTDRGEQLVGAGVLGTSLQADAIGRSMNRKKRTQIDRQLQGHGRRMKAIRATVNQDVRPTGNRERAAALGVGSGKRSLQRAAAAGNEQARGSLVRRTNGPQSSSQQKRVAQRKAIARDTNDLRTARKIPRISQTGVRRAQAAGLLTGAGLLWHGTRNDVEKRELKHKDIDAGALGAVGGQAAYQGVSYGLKPVDRRAERKIVGDDRLKAIAAQHRKKHLSVPKGVKQPEPSQWHNYFRTTPTSLPGARLKRTLSVTHSGNTGTIVGASATAAGALAAMRLRHKRATAKSGVKKAWWDADPGLKAYQAQRAARGPVPYRISVNGVEQAPKTKVAKPFKLTAKTAAKAVKKGKIIKIDTTMSEDEAKRHVARHGASGPLPKGMDRATKMKVHEARYVHHGGPKGEKYHHRQKATQHANNVSLAVGTGAGAAFLLARSKSRAVGRAGSAIARKVPKARTDRAKLAHRAEMIGVGAATASGGAQLYSNHLGHRQASHANAPAGVAASALNRMRQMDRSKS